ncbi:MAG: hypothetical protein V4568_03315 [Pseudomonadota bacterium]
MKLAGTPVKLFSGMIFLFALLLGTETIRADERSTNPAVGPDTVEILAYEEGGYKIQILPINESPPPAFEQPEFDDSTFSTAAGAFGASTRNAMGGEACPLQSTVRTPWPFGSQLLVRRVVEIPEGAADVRIMVSVDNDIAGVFFNGALISGPISHDGCPIRDEFRIDVPPAYVRSGQNFVVFHIIDRTGVDLNESFFDTRILAEFVNPIARPIIEWEMEERFGQHDFIDVAPAHLVPHFYSAAINPSSWGVYLDFCSLNPFAPTPITTYSWVVRREGQMGPLPVQSSTECRFRVELPALGKYAVSLTVSTADGRWSDALLKEIELKDYLVVSMGDSYSSGEGNPTFPVGDLAMNSRFRSPENLWYYPNKHLSVYSAHVQAALMLERSDPHSSVTFLSVAQSGATIKNIISEPQHPRYFNAVDDVVKALCDQSGDCTNSRKIDYLIFGVGGNDIGFGSIINACAVPNKILNIDVTGLPTCDVLASTEIVPVKCDQNGCIKGHLDRIYCYEDNVEDCPPLPQGRTPYVGLSIEIKLLLEDLKTNGYPSLDRAIRSRLPLAANAKLLIPEYPDPLIKNQAGQTCDNLDFKNAICGDPRNTCLLPSGNINFREVAWAHRVVFEPLNQILRDTTSLGWTPVTGIAEEGKGHAYCNSSNFTVTYLESWTTQDDLFGTLHPNRGGQEIISRHLASAMGVMAPNFVTRPQILRTSEEFPPALCEPEYAVIGAGCNGDNCDNIDLMCKPVASGVALGSASFSRRVSEETNGTFTACHRTPFHSPGCSIEDGVSCGDSGVMTGVRCHGDFCDDMELQCRPLMAGHLEDCHWTESVSDESRWNVFKAGKIANGARCDGSFCDTMSYFVCDAKP